MRNGSNLLDRAVDELAGVDEMPASSKVTSLWTKFHPDIILAAAKLLTQAVMNFSRNAAPFFVLQASSRDWKAV